MKFFSTFLALASVASALPLDTTPSENATALETRAYEYMGTVCVHVSWQECYGFHASPGRCENLTGRLHDTMTSYDISNLSVFCTFYKDINCSGTTWDTRQKGPRRELVDKAFNDVASSVKCFKK